MNTEESVKRGVFRFLEKVQSPIASPAVTSSNKKSLYSAFIASRVGVLTSMSPKRTSVRCIFSAVQQHKDIDGSSATAETKIAKIHLTDVYVLFGDTSTVDR